MIKRYWPAVLASLAVLVFGSYLAYTQFLSRRIQRDVDLMMHVYAEVQAGISAATGVDTASAYIDPLSPEASGYITALSAIQIRLQEVGIPVVILNAQDRAYAWMNIPGVDNYPGGAGDAERAQDYAVMLREQYPENVMGTPVSTLVYGKHPILKWLDWIPWLQVTGGLLVVLVAVAVIRSDYRAERERLWSAMARELAHQMGTPLSSLTGWIEILRLPDEESEGMPSREQIAEVISADVERLERVSRRFELIGKPPELEPVQLAEVVGELQRYMGPRLPKLGPGVRLRVRLPDDLPPVHGSRVLLAWALENVVKNAVDALAGRGGRILITAECPADDLRLHIADNGPGIDPRVRDRIFEAGVTSKSSGWGVGLALTRRIVENVHRGRISARGRKRGGTVFDITLPVIRA